MKFNINFSRCSTKVPDSFSGTYEEWKTIIYEMSDIENFMNNYNAYKEELLALYNKYEVETIINKKISKSKELWKIYLEHLPYFSNNRPTPDNYLKFKKRYDEPLIILFEKDFKEKKK